jgi:hypothetical protein
LGLWRIKADPVDLHGVIEPDEGVNGFYSALSAAVDQLHPLRPDVASSLQDLLETYGEE